VGLGLLVGSFLSMLVHRLPKILTEENTLSNGQSLSLWWPGSHCPLCESPLRWFDNLPLLGFLWQRGHCRHCGGAIAWRYPLMELSNALLWGFCVAHAFSAQDTLGISVAMGQGPGLLLIGMAWGLFSSTLLALAWIDWKTLYLPSELTQPLLWGGFIAAEFHLTGLSLSDALWGAVLGFGILWSVATAFKGLTGKDGMGAGDFKLLAALGAWLGPLNLLPLLLFASMVGAAVGLVLRARSRLREGGYVPFGPFLAAAAWLIYALGPVGMQRFFWRFLGV
jgi:leader peptidase (prepilin peptidase)/N-methyltransferase